MGGETSRIVGGMGPSALLAILASFCLSFLSWGTIYSSAVLLPLLSSHYSVGRAEAAATPALLTFLTLATGPLAASLLPRLGPRATALAGVALATGGLLAGALYTHQGPPGATILPLHLAVGGLGGLGLGLTYLPSLAVLPHHFTKHLGLAMGIACCGSGVGQAVLSPSLEVLVSHLSLPQTLCCLAAIVSTGALPALALTPPSGKHQEGARAALDQGNTGSEGNMMTSTNKTSNKLEFNEESGGTERSTLEALRSPALLLLLLSHFLVNVNLGVVGTFVFDRSLQGGLDPGEASLVLSAMGVANCLGRVLFGRVVDGWRRHALPLTAAVLLANGLVTAASEAAPGLAGQLVFAGGYGATQGGYFSSQLVVLAAVGEEGAAPLGLVLAARGLACLAGPALAGLGRDATGGYTLGFLAGGGAALLAALLVLPIAMLGGREVKETGEVEKGGNMDA